MNWDSFEAKANGIWNEFWGIVKFVFWDIPSLICIIILQILGVLLFFGLIVGAVAFLLSITF